MTDMYRPSTWKAYRKGLCEGCRADCCRLPVEVHLLEFVSMGLCLEEEALHDARNLVKRLKKERIIRLFDQKTQMATLWQKSDSGCLFLGKDGRCTIYERRPTTCREFPQVGPRPNYCPHAPI